MQHALLIAHNNFWRVEIHQLLQTIIAVDDAAIKIVQIAGGEISAFQHDKRTKVRWNHWNNIKHHPLWIILAAADLLNKLQALGQIFLALLAFGLFKFLAKLNTELIQIQLAIGKQFTNGVGAHHGGETAGAMLVLLAAALIFREHLLEFKIGRAWIGDDVILEVHNLLKIAGLHFKKIAKSAWHGLEEPNVNNWRGQINVAHALATNAAVRDLHAATIANNSLVLGALVLAACAFIIALWPEDALTKQTVALGAVGAVVDGLGFLNFTKAPRTNVVGAGKADAYGAVIIHTVINAVVGNGHGFISSSLGCVIRTGACNLFYCSAAAPRRNTSITF